MEKTLYIFKKLYVLKSLVLLAWHGISVAESAEFINFSHSNNISNLCQETWYRNGKMVQKFRHQRARDL